MDLQSPAFIKLYRFRLAESGFFNGHHIKAPPLLNYYTKKN